MSGSRCVYCGGELARGSFACEYHRDLLAIDCGAASFWRYDSRPRTAAGTFARVGKPLPPPSPPPPMPRVAVLTPSKGMGA